MPSIRYQDPIQYDSLFILQSVSMVYDPIRTAVYFSADKWLNLSGVSPIFDQRRPTERSFINHENLSTLFFLCSRLILLEGKINGCCKSPSHSQALWNPMTSRSESSTSFFKFKRLVTEIGGVGHTEIFSPWQNYEYIFRQIITLSYIWLHVFPAWLFIFSAIILGRSVS